MIDNYYIYIYLDPRKSGKYCYSNICFLYEPIYVGKGKGKRYREISDNKRSKLFINKINKIKRSELEPVVFKLYENLNEYQSFEFEKKLIKEIGRTDLETGTLINMTDGGEGSSGYKHEESFIIKIKKLSIGRKHSNKTKEKISKNHRDVSGKNNPMFGKNQCHHPNFGKSPTKETRKKISEKHIGKHHSEETKIKIGLSIIEKLEGKNNPMYNTHRLGKDSPNHKLKENEVWLIKKILNSDYYKSGKISQKFIGKMFNVNKATISAIKTGKLWSHIKYKGEING